MTSASRYLVGLIGSEIGASLSPRLHETEGRQLGLDYEYRLWDLHELGVPPEDVGVLLHRARDQGYAALNITYPCKQLVLQHLDELDEDARRLGAVNLVVLRQGRFVGYNTDWVGFRDGITDGLPGALLERVVQFGGGGAGSATAYALLSLGVAELTLTDLVPERMAELADRLRAAFPDQVVTVTPTDRVSGTLSAADGVVNATPIGMAHHPGVPFQVAETRADAWIADVVYRPIVTALLAAATASGRKTLDGGRMNVGQAVEGIRLITGHTPDAGRMRAHFLRLISAENAAPA